MRIIDMVGIALRPFFTIALFVGAAFIAHHILKRMQPGRLKAILSRRLPIIPRTEAERRDWWPVILIWGFTAVLYAGIWFSDPMGHH